MSIFMVLYYEYLLTKANRITYLIKGNDIISDDILRNKHEYYHLKMARIRSAKGL